MYVGQPKQCSEKTSSSNIYFTLRRAFAMHLDHTRYTNLDRYVVFQLKRYGKTAPVASIMKII